MLATYFYGTIWVLVHMLEAFGVLVISFAGIRAFWSVLIRTFDLTEDSLRVNLAKALAVGLEFKLAAEIIKTVLVRTLDEIYILAAVVILRVIMTFVLNWEIRNGDISIFNSVEKESKESKESVKAGIEASEGANEQ
jgi:uncharacterized membrane protein